MSRGIYIIDYNRANSGEFQIRSYEYIIKIGFKGRVTRIALNIDINKDYSYNTGEKDIQSSLISMNIYRVRGVFPLFLTNIIRH